jgi:hypothetical protein
MVRAITVPSLATVATVASLLDHVRALFVALAGDTVAVSVSRPPTPSGNVFSFSETPETGTGDVTFTLQVLVLPPSVVRTVITAMPVAMAFTLPSELTVAIAGLLLDHVRPCMVAWLGNTDANSVSLPPTPMVVDVLLSATPVALTTVEVTFTMQYLVKGPVVAEMIAVPGFTAVTTPF